MEFSPKNNIVKLCVQGISLEEKGEPEKAGEVFIQAWNEASDDFERFLAAFFAARHQKDAPGRLKWLEMSLRFALNINDQSVKSAFLPSI